MSNLHDYAAMFTVLLILGTIVALCFAPVATILGLLGVWIFGFWGAVIGIFLGLCVCAWDAA